MFESDVECKDCHEGDNQTISKEYALNCSSCHEDEYDDLIEEWQVQTKLKISAINTALSNFVYYDLDKASRQKIDSIRYGIEKIEDDKSLGVHNIELITDLLDQYLNMINEL